MMADGSLMKEGHVMSTNLRIVMFSDDEAMTSNVRDCVKHKRTTQIDAHADLMSQMNGSAVKFAEGGDLIIFRAGDNPESEISALKSLRASVGTKRAILALADENLSLAAIRGLTAAGASEVIPYPAPLAELAERIEHWTRAAEYPVPAIRRPDDRLGRVVSVAQARGGLGATTLAVNLAHRLMDSRDLIKKKRSYKVALIDLDLQYGSVASFLDVEPSDALYRLATGNTVPDATYMDQSLVDHPSGLQVLTAPETFCPLDALDQAQAAAIIDALRIDFDFIVIDLPRGLASWMPAVIDRTDRMLLLTETTVPCIRQARRLIEVFTEEALNLDVEIVVSHETKPMISKRHHSEAERVLERPFKHWLPLDAKACRLAVDRGAPLASAASRSALSRGIDGIARGLIKEIKTRHAAVGAEA